ncbi:hypothetical protein TNCT_141931 [Trichonephila clavata]|uniref:Uncharacterized protein n=1 Tax=Trichonephila clavata TaxID=2740835 RepID=A0A8X6H380_TRICU|nr:hypothetical protein TNCT_141931 [Trichonephila clavata]
MREIEVDEEIFDPEMEDDDIDDELFNFDFASLSAEELEKLLRDFFTEDYGDTVGMSNEEVDDLIDEFIERCKDPEFSPALFFKDRIKEMEQLLEEKERELRILQKAFEIVLRNQVILWAAGLMPVTKHDVRVSTNFFE